MRPMSRWSQALNHDPFWHWGAKGYVVWSRGGLWSLICSCRGLRPDCDDRVRISIKSLKTAPNRPLFLRNPFSNPRGLSPKPKGHLPWAGIQKVS